MSGSFRTVEGRFRYRISLPYRRSLFFAPHASENASRTPGSHFEHRMRIPYRRRPSPVPNATNGRKEKSIACSEYHKAKNEKALPATNATKPKMRKHCLQRVSQIPERRRALPVPNATTARKEVFPLTQRGVRCEKRSPPHRGKQKENDIKNRSLSNLGCDVGLEPTTPRTTIWCSTN